MTPDSNPAQSVANRALRAAAVVVAVIVGAYAVIGGGSYLGRLVGSKVGDDGVTNSPVAVAPGIPVTVDIEPGSSAQDIAATLTAKGVVRSALDFELAVRNVNAAERLQAGSYEMVTLMDPAEVVALLVTGPGAAVYRVTVIEGLRVPEILTRLAEASGLPYADFQAALLGGDVSTSLKELSPTPALQDWEGLLFPDTYEFARTADPASILQRLASTMEQRVGSIDWSPLDELGLTPYQGIIIASLIEAEVLHDEERPLVSSVLHNRLSIGMKLDIDATVLYALDTRDVALFDRDFESPYNTYRVNGLPPTPIAAPGKASLDAAADPAETDYLFYVLSDLAGFHAFAATIEEHNANVAQARADGVLP